MKPPIPQDKEALLIVDYQNGFIPENEGGTGELGVEGGWLLAPRINELIFETRRNWGLIIATRDTHPPWHMSFVSNYLWKKPFDTIDWDEVVNHIPNELQLSKKAGFTKVDLASELGATLHPQVLWPDHCIAETPSAQYHKNLDTTLIDHHIIKGYDAKTEMYSGFYGREGTPLKAKEKWKTLSEILIEAGITTVRLVWIATDYCVAATARDAVKNGFKAIIESSAIAGVYTKTPSETIAFLETLRERYAVEYV